MFTRLRCTLRKRVYHRFSRRARRVLETFLWLARALATANETCGTVVYCAFSCKRALFRLAQRECILRNRFVALLNGRRCVVRRGLYWRVEVSARPQPLQM